LVFGGEAISVLLWEIASGEKQERPRNDIVLWVAEGTYIFTNPKSRMILAGQSPLKAFGDNVGA